MMETNVFTRLLNNVPRPILVLRLTAFMAIVQVLISYKVWIGGDRIFPVIPLFEAFSFDLGSFGNFILFLLFLSGLGSMVLLPVSRVRYGIFGILGIIVLLVLQDIMRIQVWLYMYSLIWIIVLNMLSAKGMPIDHRTEQIALNALRWVVALVYIWSGLHKFNAHYTTNVFNWLMGIYDFTHGLKNNQFAAFSTAAIEVIYGLFFLFPRLWRIGCWSSLLFHGVILFFLVGDSWNLVVYPWNLNMVGLVWILFYTKERSSNRITPFPYLRSLAGGVLVISFLILPALNAIDFTNPHFSFCMYTGLSTDSSLYWQAPDENCLPEEIRSQKTTSSSTTTQETYLDNWSINAIGVPVFPNEYYYKKIASKFCSCLKDQKYSGLGIVYHPRFSKAYVVAIPCEELLKNK